MLIWSEILMDQNKQAGEDQSTVADEIRVEEYTLHAKVELWCQQRMNSSSGSPVKCKMSQQIIKPKEQAHAHESR